MCCGRPAWVLARGEAPKVPETRTDPSWATELWGCRGSKTFGEKTRELGAGTMHWRGSSTRQPQLPAPLI